MSGVRRILSQVLSLPTAPMHEEAVARFVRAFASRQGLGVRADRFGNLLLRSGSGRPRYVVMAHMDHPGFEVVGHRGRRVIVKIRGGLDPRASARARLRFFVGGQEIRGRGVGHLVTRASAGHRRPTMTFHAVTEQPVPRGAFAMFDIPPVRVTNGIVRARAIDNIANCALILDLLATACRRRQPVMGVLTRAEEIGCVGARALLRARALPHGVPVIVLETSSAKAAKVTIGAGPVIRVGDKVAAFDPVIDMWLHHVASRLVKQGSFRFQRALMPGGMTEGTYYMMEGLSVGSLAIPLGNYHNRGTNGPRPEQISWSDWRQLKQLLLALCAAPSPKKVLQQVRRKLWRERE
ncbi:MAG: hypothetical protein HYV03_06710 [Deltaproteobacteria bacterium]|nr:hypothetical protein [Deltaproteobacteria bacterium]